jgi:hypothetical protein
MAWAVENGEVIVHRRFTPDELEEVSFQAGDEGEAWNGQLVEAAVVGEEEIDA